ncbi:hypothetical protein VNO77_19806 [Canavalia gladiata]|uniref:Uncharacterized protein n=1 Tax=Canavalia gladiata TaxID=3824 RepID=A0AAN9QIU0_CANGL
MTYPVCPSPIRHRRQQGWTTYDVTAERDQVLPRSRPRICHSARSSISVPYDFHQVLRMELQKFICTT